MRTVAIAVDRLAARATAFDGFAALVAACRTGYVPSMRRRDRASCALGVILEVAGCRVYWGSRG